MARQLHTVVPSLRRMLDPQRGDLSDGELLEAFFSRHDHDAFEALVRRHGPRVLAQCRRVVGEAAADDAFQVVFFALARKGRSLRRRRSLAAWLYRVAQHVAVRAGTREQRRRQVEKTMRNAREANADGTAESREVVAVVESELARLPDKYRAVLLLCGLEEKTHAEAARVLGLPMGSMSKRLARARELLRRRLAKRGVTLTAAAIAGACAADAHAMLPENLLQTTVQHALPVAMGRSLYDATAHLSSNVADLLKETLPMVSAKNKLWILLLATAILTAAGSVSLAVARSGRVHEAKFSGASSASPSSSESPSSSQPRTSSSSASPSSSSRSDPPPASSSRSEAPASSSKVEPPKPSSEEPKERFDAEGEPLPKDILVRMGSRNLRGDRPECAVISPNSKILAVGSAPDRASTAPTVSLWDIETGKRIRDLKGCTVAVKSLAFTPDSKELITGAYDGGMTMWDVDTGKALTVFEEKKQSLPTRIVISSDGKTAYTCGIGGAVHVWEVKTGQKIKELEGHAGEVTGISLSPDDKQLVSASKDGTMRLWDATHGTQIKKFDIAKTDVPACPVFSNDGKLIYGAITAIGQGKLLAWNAATGEEVQDYKLARRTIHAFALSDDGKTVAVAEHGGDLRDTSIRILDLQSGDEIRKVPLTGVNLKSLAWSANGKTLATVMERDELIRVYDAENGKLLHDPAGHYGRVVDLLYMPDGKRIVSVGAEGDLRLWAADTGKPIATYIDPMGSGPTSAHLAIDSANGQLLTHGMDRVVTAGLEDLPQGGPQVFRGPKQFNRLFGGIGASALSPKWFALCNDSRIRLLDCTTGKEGDSITAGAGQKLNPHMMAFSLDGRFLVGRNMADKTLRVWNVETREQVLEIKNVDMAGPVAFSPDGSLLASGDFSNEILVFERLSGRKLWRYDIKQGDVPLCLDFSSDNKLVAAGHRDGVVSVLSVATGKLVNQFPKAQNSVTSVRFSPDGKRLASGGGDGTILIRDVSESGKSAEPAEPVEHKPDKTDLAALWASLAADDVKVAQAAVQRLAAEKGAAVALIKEHLKDERPVDAKNMDKYIADLSSNEAKVRNEAAAALESLGEVVIEPLEKMLDGNPSAEARAKAGKIIATVKSRNKTASSPKLQRLRAIDVLARIGDKDAIAVLEQMAEDKTPDVAREAQTALNRLKAGK